MNHSRLLLTLACALSLGACGSLKANETVKNPTGPATMRLTLVPQSNPVAKKSTPVEAKITRMSDRSRVLAEELSEGSLRLLAIDSNYNDFQLITAKKSTLPGLFSFSFTPFFAAGLPHLGRCGNEGRQKRAT